MATIEYVVYRHGMNKANQPGVSVKPVGVYSVDGPNAEVRMQTAEAQADDDFVVYANQHLSAKPAARCSAADIAEAAEYQRASASLWD